MENLVTPHRDFWAGKRVLLTGHTGFKGSWLTQWLNRLGANVTGLSLDPHTTPSLFNLAAAYDDCDSQIGDIRDLATVQKVLAKANPEIVFHMAAQALVRASYSDPLSTFAVNVQGTTNILEALRGAPQVKVAVFITTDKVYCNREWPYPYREDDQLGGHDPYSASKAASELVIASYRDAFLRTNMTAVATARAGNVIGGGDWSADRIIPDAIRAWQNNQALEIRNPESVRPWQHVLEPLAGYLQLAESLWQRPALAGPFNFGPNTNEIVTVRKLMSWAQEQFVTVNTQFAPKNEALHETGCLALEIAKAGQLIGWHPKWTTREAVRRTMKWYSALASGAAAKTLCNDDITAYEQTPS